MWRSVAVVALCCVAATAALPRVRRELPLNLPGGIPLMYLFASCDSESQQGDIGPCLAQLLSGIIDSQRGNFTTGVAIGDDVVVLEPLTIDDVDPKPDREFQFGATNLKLHGIEEIQVDNVTITVDKFAIEFSLPLLAVSGDLSLKYLFLSAEPTVRIDLQQVGVHLSADWGIEAGTGDESGELFVQMKDVKSKLDIKELNVEIEKLSGLGTFIRNLFNKNSSILLKFFIPDLEESINKKLNEKKVTRFRIAD